LEVRERGGDTVDMPRMREIEIGKAHRRRSLMKEDRQPKFLGTSEDRERLRSERIEVLVIGAKLDTAQAEGMNAALALIQRVRMEGMHSREANDLCRIRLHERRGIVIHPWGFVDELAVIGHIAARIGRDVEDNGAIDAFERAHMLVPGMRSGGRLIG